MFRKIWYSSSSQKCLSASEISVIFNCQYFINRLISDYDFLHVDRHECKEQGLTGFLESSHLCKWTILGPKMAHPYNSGSTVRMFFLILHNERGQ